MSPGLTIQGTTLPVALLSNHCEQFLLMSAQSLATVTQPQAVELQITATQQHTQNIHPLIQLSDGKRQTQAEGGQSRSVLARGRLQINDAIVARGVRAALAAGWEPESRGKPMQFMVDADGN